MVDLGGIAAGQLDSGRNRTDRSGKVMAKAGA
jgi:hypothetical protein